MKKFKRYEPHIRLYLPQNERTELVVKGTEYRFKTRVDLSQLADLILHGCSFEEFKNEIADALSKEIVHLTYIEKVMWMTAFESELLRIIDPPERFVRVVQGACLDFSCKVRDLAIAMEPNHKRELWLAA